MLNMWLDKQLRCGSHSDDVVISLVLQVENCYSELEWHGANSLIYLFIYVVIVTVIKTLIVMATSEIQHQIWQIIFGINNSHLVNNDLFINSFM